MAEITDICCSFCDKTRKEVCKLISKEGKSPFICDECILLCMQILLQEQAIDRNRKKNSVFLDSVEQAIEEHVKEKKGEDFHMNPDTAMHLRSDLRKLRGKEE